MNRALWIIQVLLALLFVLASGAPKLLLPPETLPMPIPLPYSFVLFIGVAEVLGGLGLILPAITGVRPGLVPLAASGLVLVTLGATAYQFAAALFPVAVGLLCAFVAYGRWQLAPLRGSRRSLEREPVP
jgi:uncharacterized membrane protein